MKAAKIKSCGPCPYRGHKADVCTLLMEDGYPVDITKQIEKQAIHPSCPLPDWPTFTIEQVSAIFDHAVGIIGEGRGTRFIVDCLRTRGVIVKEEKNESPSV